MEVADRDHLVLQHRHGRQTAFRRVSRERVILPELPPGHQWVLNFDDGGWGFFSDGQDDVRWASSILTKRVVRDEGRTYILQGDGEPAELGECLNENRRKHLPMFVGAASLVILAWVFSHEQIGGFRWWWGLASLWTSLQPSHIKAGEWVANLWRHWLKRFGKVGLGHPHLRPSARMRECPAYGVAPGFEVDGRVLSEPSVSTPMLLVLLARLSNVVHNSGPRQRNAEEAGRWRSFAEEVLKLTLPADFEVQVFLAMRAPQHADSIPAGHHKLCFSVVGGSFRPKNFDLRLPVPGALLREFRHREAVPAFELLMAMDRAGAATWPCLWQLAMALALQVEATLSNLEKPDDLSVHLSPARQLSRVNRSQLGRLAQALRARLQADSGNLVCRYFFAMRKAFGHKPQFFSLACDATRMGKRSCMVGCIALPNNVFAWCPPQVSVSGCGGSFGVLPQTAASEGV